MSIATVALLFLYASAVSVAEADSYSWGHVNKYAAPIYEELVFVDGVNASVSYPPAESLNFDHGYTITAMYAFDMQSEDDEVRSSGDAFVLRGGIGHNHTTVLFYSKIGSSSYQVRGGGGDGGMHYKFVVYGLEL